MNTPVWNLNHREARLQCGELTALIDLTRPDRGLTQFGWQGQSLAGEGLLGLELPAIDLATPDGVECYPRGVDLVATYAAADGWPFRTQVYWRAWPTGTTAHLAAVELVASVQTHLLESDPRLFARSRLRARSAWRLVDASTGRFETCQSGGVQSHTLACDQGNDCTLIDLPDGAARYVEMVHPVDFERTELTATPGVRGETTWTLRHSLFASNLEKGVILRARVLAAWFPAESSDEDIAALYRDFAASEPPLTT